MTIDHKVAAGFARDAITMRLAERPFSHHEVVRLARAYLAQGEELDQARRELSDAGLLLTALTEEQAALRSPSPATTGERVVATLTRLLGNAIEDMARCDGPNAAVEDAQPYCHACGMTDADDNGHREGCWVPEAEAYLETARALREPAVTVDEEGAVNKWAREHRAEIEQAYRDEFGLPDGMDRNLLHAALWEIVRRIENCGASPALTHAVVLASDLMGAVGNEFNKPRAYDLVRVVEAVGPHNTWSAVCEKCQREWIAVYPAGTRTIACPGCGHCNDTPEAAAYDDVESEQQYYEQQDAEHPPESQP